MWILLLLTIHSLFIALTHAATAEQWRERRIYQVLTDRFAKKDNDSPSSCDTSQRRYCGGTWKGITIHLDYIEQLGFDAVWISPIVANIEGMSEYGEGYHGYWTRDITTLNSNFGTADDLKALSSALHSRGMYLMIDVVVNHYAIIPSNKTSESPNVNGTLSLDFSSTIPFSQTNFHPFCPITGSDYTSNQTAVEQCWLGDANLPLADLNTEDQNIVQTMLNWIKNVTATYDIDGLRIDTVKHIRKEFWPDFVKAAGVFTLGEVLINDVDYAAEYTKVIDGILDYPTHFIVTSAFGSNTGNLSAVVDVVTRSQKAYNNGLSLSGSFLENHDQPRFQSITQDPALVKNAMAWSFIQDGIPILYYGQEQGFQGNSDPSNREAMWPSGYVTEKALVAHVRALNAARKQARISNKQFHNTSAQFIPQSLNSTLAVSKPPLLALLTNFGQNSSLSASSQPSWTIPASMNLFKKNETLVDTLTCKLVYADGDGGLVVSADGGMPLVLLPISALNKNSALCPKAAQRARSSGSRIQGSMAVLWSAVVIAYVARYLAEGYYIA